MNDFVEKYNSRIYVQQIKRGHQFFWTGFLIAVAVTVFIKGTPFNEIFWTSGGLWAFIAGIIHIFDSRSRIRKLRNKLKN